MPMACPNGITALISVTIWCGCGGISSHHDRVGAVGGGSVTGRDAFGKGAGLGWGRAKTIGGGKIKLGKITRHQFGQRAPAGLRLGAKRLDPGLRLGAGQVAGKGKAIGLGMDQTGAVICADSSRDHYPVCTVSRPQVGPIRIEIVNRGEVWSRVQILTN